MSKHPEITLSAHSGFGRAIVNWTDKDEYRYHVWIDDNGKPDGTIYKNAPRNTDDQRNPPRTQRLKLDAARWQWAKDWLTANVTAETVTKAKAEAQAKEDAEAKEKHENRIRNLRLRLIETQVCQTLWANMSVDDLLKLERAFRG